MTTKELEQKVSVIWKGTSTYEIRIEYRGKFYTTISNDSICYDRIVSQEDGRNVLGITYKQALQKFYNYCKLNNNIN